MRGVARGVTALENESPRAGVACALAPPALANERAGVGWTRPPGVFETPNRRSVSATIEVAARRGGGENGVARVVFTPPPAPEDAPRLPPCVGADARDRARHDAHASAAVSSQAMKSARESPAFASAEAGAAETAARRAAAFTHSNAAFGAPISSSAARSGAELGQGKEGWGGGGEGRGLMNVLRVC